MNRNKIFCGILIVFLISSCDPVFRAEIKNETSEAILIEVAFDRQELEKSWNGESYLPFVISYPNNGRVENAIAFDTVNLTKTFKLLPGSSFPLEGGVGTYPDYKLFRSLQIFYKDTIALSTKTQIASAFQQTGARQWVLSVK